MGDLTSFIIIYLIIILLWLPQAVYQIVTWTYWWQVKEYRFDRFWEFLKTSDGREKLGIFYILLKFMGLALGFYYLPIPIFIFAYLDFLFLRDFLKRSLRKPQITQRIERIFATSFFGVVITILIFYFLGIVKALLLGEFFLILSPYIGILWTIPIVNRVKNKEILKAKKIISEVKPIVIGITGSYGKTTTKEFVAHLLSQKYKTAKTEGSENTEFGIARKTFNNVKKDTKYFVVEMGAYKEGEIKKLTDIVSPMAGIITGIEEQHLSLFGSLSNIKKAKFELIESLPEKGIAIFNITNNEVQKLLERAKRLKKSLKIYSYYMITGKDRRKNASLNARVINAAEEGIEFEVTDGKERRNFFAPLHGLHFIENITGAILVARILGITWREIERGVLTLETPEHTMRVYNLKNGNVIIDDTFNTTPLGFEAALSYLLLFENKRKMVITPGIIELGEQSNRIHERLGKLMNGMVNEVILLNKEPFMIIKSVVDRKTSVALIKDPDELLRELEDLSDSVILLEGRQPVKLLNYLEEQKND